MAIKVTRIKPEFSDERGFISRIVDQDKYPIHSVLFITSKKGTTRGNHYHKTDAHYVYCLSGQFRYTEKDIHKPKAKKESVILKPGDLVLSSPMRAHAMEFLEDSVFLAITTERRDQKAYEHDTVRINITSDE